MSSILAGTDDIEAIVQSGLRWETLDIFIDAADAEIVASFGAHPVIPELPQGASPEAIQEHKRQYGKMQQEFDIRAGVLVDLVRIGVQYSGAKSIGAGDGLSVQNWMNNRYQRQCAMRPLAEIVDDPYTKLVRGE